MKRMLCLITTTVLLLCGCGNSPAEITKTTTAATDGHTTEAVTTVTTAVTESVITPTDEAAPTDGTDTTATTTTTIGEVSHTATITTATTEVTQGMTTTTTATTAGTQGTTTTTTATAGTSGSSATTQSTTTVAVPSKTAKPSRTGISLIATTTTTVTTTTADPNGITILEPQDNLVVESQASVVDEYLAITDEKQAAKFWTGYYTHMAHGARVFLSWESKGNLWKVYFSEDPQFTDTKPILTTDTWMQFSGLMPGKTYYWKVVNTFGMASDTRRVTVKDTTVRWIDVDGGDNIRDLGGWKTESGKTVKYGLLYRGGCIDGYNGGPLLTQQGRDTFTWLGVRSEIDLRGNDVGKNDSPFGARYYKATITQYDYIFNNNETKASLKTIFNILSFKGSYPVYFHCNAGADRTGTLSFIINGLLGVSYEDLTRDFELTCFSGRGKRLRSKLDEETATFDPSGVMQRTGGNYIAWGPLYDTMMDNYSTASGKLSDAIENFLKTECNVSQQEIDTVRSIMLE